MVENDEPSASCSLIDRGNVFSHGSPHLNFITKSPRQKWRGPGRLHFIHDFFVVFLARVFLIQLCPLQAIRRPGLRQHPVWAQALALL